MLKSAATAATRRSCVMVSRTTRVRATAYAGYVSCCAPASGERGKEPAAGGLHGSADKATSGTRSADGVRSHWRRRPRESTVVDKQTQQICRPDFFTLHKLYHSAAIRFLIPMSSHSSEYDERIKMASATIAKILATHPFLVGLS
jgi:hypothetical protein